MDQPTLASVLMGVEDDPITKRGMLWPRVERQSGKAELGWPSFLKEPWDALQRLSAGGYQPGTGDEQGVRDSFTLAGALTGGGLGLNWAGQVPKGVIGSAGGKLPEQGIRAYHGSPHDFDKFDTTKIGTGEGAQAYGHGLYFAESEGVARKYRDDLTPTYYYENGRKLDGAEQNAASMLLDHKMTKAEAADYIKNSLRTSRMADQEYLDRTAAALEKLDPSAITQEAKGRMYEVRINADPESFLDWDKPLSQQSEGVKGALRSVGQANPNIAHLFSDKALAGELGNMPSSSIRGALEQQGFQQPDALFRDAGIPGIKYLDQGSRAGGEGTRNYVVFDADKIEILKKYGWVPAGMVGGGMMMTPPEGQEGF